MNSDRIFELMNKQQEEKLAYELSKAKQETKEKIMYAGIEIISAQMKLNTMLVFSGGQFTKFNLKEK